MGNQQLGGLGGVRTCLSVQESLINARHLAGLALGPQAGQRRSAVGVSGWRPVTRVPPHVAAVGGGWGTNNNNCSGDPSRLQGRLLLPVCDAQGFVARRLEPPAPVLRLDLALDDLRAAQQATAEGAGLQVRQDIQLPCWSIHCTAAPFACLAWCPVQWCSLRPRQPKPAVGD